MQIEIRDQMYLFAYFKTACEKLFYATSDDAQNWRPFRNGRPILSASLGTATIRDPFIIETSPGQYVLMCSNGFHSEEFLRWKSDDLLHWHSERLIPLMPSGYCVWAPKAFRTKQGFLLLWASARGNGDKAIWCALTEDFETFSPAQRFFYPGFSVIDPFLVKLADGRHLLFFKDERGASCPTTKFKGIRAVPVPTPPSYEPSTETEPVGQTPSAIISPPLTEGPCLICIGGRWRLFCDPYAKPCGGYWSADCDDLEQMYRSPTPKSYWTPVKQSFPCGSIRHGCCIKINDGLLC
ncbi:MAG: family 43 glycosylhydrolase [Sulfobacillus sp.]